MNGQAQPSYEELQNQNHELSERIERLEEDLSNVLTQYRELKRHVFGRKSEKLGVIGEGQQQLFEASDLKYNSEPEDEVEISAYKRSKRNGRKALPEDLPRERVEYEPETTSCSCCGGELEKIGEEVSEELEYVPARFFVREHVRIKRACSRCKDGVETGVLPPDAQVLEKSRVGVGLLAYILVSKYCDHLPLHRLEQMFRRYGIELARSTLCDWVAQAVSLLEPVAEQVKVEILAAAALYADGTVIKVQDSAKKGLHQGYLWGALAPPGVYFHYSKSRAGSTAMELFSGYEGYVHTDCYAGYNPVFLPEGCQRVGCWAHVRRKFIEVQKLSKRDVDRVLKLIAELYKIEKRVKALSREERQAMREKKSKPTLDKLKEFLDDLNERTLPRHPLKKALNYTLKQWKELVQYAENGILSIDNNPIERQIRPIAIGRKNYLFAGSHDGARRAAVLYTLINTCKMHGVNPYEYLCDVLKKVHTHPASQISELTPLGWKEKFA